MIKIVIAEDQSLLRGALATLLDLEDDMEVVATAKDGRDALEQIHQYAPDILVSDIEMPFLSGIEVAQKIKQAALKTRILMVTTFARPGYLQRAMQAGVKGYVLKDASSDELANAVRRVTMGETYIASELASSAWAVEDPLSDREREILRLAEAGRTNKEIGLTLKLTDGTVRNYLAQATQKLDASNRIEAFRIARDNGWL